MDEDRLDQLLREAAQAYHRPPAVPRDEIWARVQAARKAGRDQGAPAIDLASRRPVWTRWRPWIALAATLLLGVALGRLVQPSPAPAPPPVAAAAPEAPSTAARLAAVDHLSRIETLLTEYRAGETGPDFHAAARDLLAQTRLWLDGDRLTDPRLRSLLEDLELMLVQIVQLAPQHTTDEREIIDQGMAERQIRTRLRAAIPAGPSA